MPSPQKAKGSNFERDIAKMLSETYDESFIRTPGSGAYVGGMNQARKEFLHEGQIRAFKGDIVPPMHWKYFNAECKFYADFPFHQLYSDCKTLDGWISQLLDVEDSGDVNILFMKFNRKGTLVAIEEKHQFDIPQYTRHKTQDRYWNICDLSAFMASKFNTQKLKELCNT